MKTYSPLDLLVFAYLLAACDAVVGPNSLETAAPTTPISSSHDASAPRAERDAAADVGSWDAQVTPGDAHVTNADAAASAAGPTVNSRYWSASDGIELAIDVWLPEAEGPHPTLLQLTRYWRAFEGETELDNNRLIAQTLAASGVAVVLLDARGSGASFGKWTGPWSTRELQDFAELATWVTEQPWSNGRLAAWGISYDGTAADLLSASGVNVLAIAPLFVDYDPYLSIVRPGGLLQETFLRGWSETNLALDSGDVCAHAGMLPCEQLLAQTSGIKPVDDDETGELLRAAIGEHAANVDTLNAAQAAPFRDSPFGNGGSSLSQVSPYHYAEQASEGGAAVYAVASWLDAGTAGSALARYARNKAPQRVRIGAYSHGGTFNVDPFLPFDAAAAPPITQLIGEMFDVIVPPLFGAPADSVGRSIDYYVMRSGEWRSTESWPPAGVDERRWYLREGGQLSSEKTETETHVDYDVDFSATSGETNRWVTQLRGSPVIYGDRAEADAKLLTFTSAPVTEPFVIVGQPTVALNVQTSVPDAAFYAYLEVVNESGVVTYVTEGQLRAIHRRDVKDAPGQGVFHSFETDDALPLEIDEYNVVQWAMEPVAVAVYAGDRLRVALAGHDNGNFERVPQTGEVTWKVGLGAELASSIVLPISSQ